MEGKDNVVLFPKWKKQLEEESLDALKGKRYHEALEKLDQLIDYNEASQEVFVGKLICLMELGEFENAQSLVEQLLGRRDDGYYDYMHIYLTLLFQTDQHDLLVETVDDVLERDNVPQMMKEQYQQLYAISENMRSDLLDRKRKEDMAALEEAVEAGDHRRQWNLIEGMRKTRTEPDRYILDMLAMEDIHPVTKTAILLWLRKKQFSQRVTVSKFDKVAEIVPAELPSLEQSEPGPEVRRLMEDAEQQNPSKYRLMSEALARYIYVIYPMEAPENSANCLIRALELLAGEEEAEHDDAACQKYIEQLNTCQALYLSIIES